jgi:hypothetical protein
VKLEEDEVSPIGIIVKTIPENKVAYIVEGVNT